MTDEKQPPIDGDGDKPTIELTDAAVNLEVMTISAAAVEINEAAPMQVAGLIGRVREIFDRGRRAKDIIARGGEVLDHVKKAWEAIQRLRENPDLDTLLATIRDLVEILPIDTLLNGEEDPVLGAAAWEDAKSYVDEAVEVIQSNDQLREAVKDSIAHQYQSLNAGGKFGIFATKVEEEAAESIVETTGIRADFLRLLLPILGEIWARRGS